MIMNMTAKGKGYRYVVSQDNGETIGTRTSNRAYYGCVVVYRGGVPEPGYVVASYCARPDLLLKEARAIAARYRRIKSYTTFPNATFSVYMVSMSGSRVEAEIHNDTMEAN